MGTEPQVNFSISLISCDIHSLVKRHVQLDVKHNDSPSHVMQSDALSCELTQISPSPSIQFKTALAPLIQISCCFVFRNQQCRWIKCFSFFLFNMAIITSNYKQLN